MTRPVALVTGASRGIGECIAGTLDNMGYACALVARTESDLRSVRDTLGDHHRVFPADLNRPDQMERLVERVTGEMGRLDVLINNAGVGASGRVQEGDFEDWHRAIHVNTLSLMSLTRAASRYLIESDKAAVINTVSISGQKVQGGDGAYAASKHAARAFTLATFEDLREHGVKVCAICPGLVNTDLTAGYDEADKELMISPSDIAYTVRFVLEFPATGCPTEITIRPQHNPLKGDA